MMNYNILFNSNSTAMPELAPLTPHNHCLDNFTGDIQESSTLVDSRLFDSPKEPRVDAPDHLLADKDTAQPPLKRTVIDKGLRLLTLKNFHNFISNSKNPEPNHRELVNFTDDIEWIASCPNFSPTGPCVVDTSDQLHATGNTVLPPTGTPIVDSTSLQVIDEIALPTKAPQPSLAPDSNKEQRKEIGRKRWSPEEHRLFLQGLEVCGAGNWKSIARQFVRTRTHIQIASHAQKFYIRCNSNASADTRGEKRKSIYD